MRQPSTSAPHILTLVALAGLSALTMNIFLPSLPTMTTHFGVEYGVMQLSVALYLMFNALLQIILGPLSDRFGRRPILLMSIALFCVATVGTLIAPTAETFLLARSFQAVIAAGLVLSRAIVRDLYAQDEAASMIGYVTMGMAVVPMIGPAIGGVLDGAFGWKANFWLLLACGIFLFALVYWDLGETSKRQPTSFRAQFADYPDLLTSRRFWGYCMTSAFASGAFFAYLGGAPFVGSEVFGLSPALVGLYFGSPAVGYFVGNFLSGRYSVRIGVNRMVLWGALLVATGMSLSLLFFALGLKTALVFFGFMTFVGLGNGMVIPNATAGMLSVRPHLAGTASGLGGAMMIGGGAALSALAGALLTVETGAWPLLWIMVLTSYAAVGCIVYTIRRDRQVKA
ncbi:multidrug effflux MFS transporter [Nereida sp. MMG025]|uniref:multidrug effflux MFS transporter n=1 Tax=Nereida sp. MMG025 TaxID=2909981 RepID=UPI001F32CEFA|nr:multidrug effflux MFS transporter [Nereida sp. MMG025]MCF6443922.1 multidrug effflux MFS transporter [Nereida sp. MMG025]